METNKQISSVPKEIFSQFISGLESNNISAQVIERLKKTLIDDEDTSKATIEQALFSNESSSI